MLEVAVAEVVFKPIVDQILQVVKAEVELEKAVQDRQETQEQLIQAEAEVERMVLLLIHQHRLDLQVEMAEKELLY
jgi:hypothetical protein